MITSVRKSKNKIHMMNGETHLNKMLCGRTPDRQKSGTITTVKELITCNKCKRYLNLTNIVTI